MQRKSTTELLKELENFNSFEDYKNANRDNLIDKSLSEYLCELISERNLSKAEVIRESELNENYAYQLLSGHEKSPQRDKLICLSVGMGLSVKKPTAYLSLCRTFNLFIQEQKGTAL